jgi:hypothetical protein
MNNPVRHHGRHVSPLSSPPDDRTRPARKHSGRGASTNVRRVTKKEQIRSLFFSGITDIEELAIITGTRSSYVASVLQKAEMLPGYFDLYTTTARPMNVHSKFFAKRLGFKDEDIARRSVKILDHFHKQFELMADRAGQHHALALALTMFNRARWTGKTREAAVFRDWLCGKLDAEEVPADSSRLPRVM